jgi:hypothetical protein
MKSKKHPNMLTTEKFILKFGNSGGDFSYLEVVRLLEHEHLLTKRMMRFYFKDKENYT